jgi:phospholipid-binding lipoprotein MlaA
MISLPIRLQTMASLFAISTVVACCPTSAFSEPEEPYDPLESVNRGIFDFNDTLDVYAIEPVSRTYRNNVPDFLQTGITNFFLNLRYPSYLVSDILQGKFEQALEHTGRFLINTTVGIVGLVDVAEDIGLPDHEEDFGTALAYHGVPAGPYLVLPLLGPSNVRDGVGRIVDGFLDPIGWIYYSSASSGVKLGVSATALGVKLINTRAGLLQAVETAKESSLDYYLFTQGAYYQYRNGVITDGAEMNELAENTESQQALEDALIDELDEDAFDDEAFDEEF